MQLYIPGQGRIFLEGGLKKQPAALIKGLRGAHLCVAAHPDDAEIMAYGGLLLAKGQNAPFVVLVVTDGGGSPRIDAAQTDASLSFLRQREQEQAADAGGYAGVFFLGLQSEKVKSPTGKAEGILAELFSLLRPRIVYTHNPADSHPTHVAVCLRTIAALRQSKQTCRLLGCEVWRGLDWLPDDKKVLLPTGNPALEQALLQPFGSQTAVKSYQLAAPGRRLANATFSKPHKADSITACNFALELTPLLTNPAQSVTEFTLALAADFTNELQKNLRELAGENN